MTEDTIGYLYRYLRKASYRYPCVCGDGREDLVQVGMLGAVQFTEKHPELADERKLLIRVAESRVIDYIRKLTRRGELTRTGNPMRDPVPEYLKGPENVPPSLPSFEPALAASIDIEHLLQSISPRQQDCIRQIHVVGEVAADYARRNKITPGRVSQLKHGALLCMKKAAGI